MVRAEACNGVGCGPYSAPRFAVEPDAAPTPELTPAPSPKSTPEFTPEPAAEPVAPAKPTEFQADATAGSLDVAVGWEEVAGASRYLVGLRMVGPIDTLNEEVEVLSSDASISVADDGEWVVRVEACNSVGCGSHNAVQFAVEPAAEPTPVPTPDLSIADPTANVSEGENATITVTLFAAVASQVQVAWSAPPGTAGAEGSDLSAAARATRTITIGVEDVQFSETAETYTVTLGAITSTQVLVKSGDNGAHATIAESDPIAATMSGVLPMAASAGGLRHGERDGAGGDGLYGDELDADVHSAGGGIPYGHGAVDGGHLGRGDGGDVHGEHFEPRGRRRPGAHLGDDIPVHPRVG